jgi:hypothetical protein
MNIGCQISEESASRLATARLDRAPAAYDDADWLDRAATQFRLAMTLQIPVGFEDEAGFHYGVPTGAAENRRHAPNPENMLTNPQQF